MFIAVFPTLLEQPFNLWSFLCALLSTICYNHFYVKEEFLIKRRSCTVFDLIWFQGTYMLAINFIGIILNSLLQLCCGKPITMLIYAKAVFSNGWTPIIYTVLVPICTGISQIIHLVILLNSSAIRLVTIYLVPVLYVLYVLSEIWTTELNIATGIVASGVLVYNFTTKCGTQLLLEEDVDVKNISY